MSSILEAMRMHALERMANSVLEPISDDNVLEISNMSTGTKYHTEDLLKR